MKKSNAALLITLGVLVAIMFAFIVYARVTFGRRLSKEGRQAVLTYSQLPESQAK